MARITSILLLIGAAWLTTMPLEAHHSISAEFDSSKPVTFTGTIKKVTIAVK